MLNVENAIKQCQIIGQKYVKCSVVFYSKAWTYRNETMHDDVKQREFAIDWHRKIVDEIEKGKKLNMKRCVRSQKLDINKCDAGYIKLWNESTMKMSKQKKNKKLIDIRNYFPVR